MSITKGEKAYLAFWASPPGDPHPPKFSDLGDESRGAWEAAAGAVEGPALSRMAALLKNVGATGKCRGCSREIFWVRHNAGKLAPYDPDGTNHFVTCFAAERFKRPNPPAGGAA